MKKLLLLGIFGILGTNLLAENKFKVTNFNQELEMENESGRETFNDVWFWNRIGFEYNNDWIFGLTAGKLWSVDLEGDGTHSKNSRVQLNASKKINDDLILGVAWRTEDSLDKYYGNWSWSKGLFWSTGEYWYESQNSHDSNNPDSINIETQLIGISYKNFKLAYYIGYYEMVGSVGNYGREHESEQQIRAFLDLYKTEKFTLSTEGRVTIHHDIDFKGRDPKYRKYQNLGRSRVYLIASYKATDNLTVYGKYGYEWRNWDYQNGDERSNYGDFIGSNGASAENYQNFVVGWNYTF